MRCPRCAADAVAAAECPRCGVVFAKLRPPPATPPVEAPPATNAPPAEIPSRRDGLPPGYPPSHLLLARAVRLLRRPVVFVGFAVLAAVAVVTWTFSYATRPPEPRWVLGGGDPFTLTPPPEMDAATPPALYVDPAVGAPQAWFEGAAGFEEAAPYWAGRLLPVLVVFYDTLYCCGALDALLADDPHQSLARVVKVRVRLAYGAEEEKRMAARFKVERVPAAYVVSLPGADPLRIAADAGFAEHVRRYAGYDDSDDRVAAIPRWERLVRVARNDAAHEGEAYFWAGVEASRVRQADAAADNLRLSLAVRDDAAAWHALAYVCAKKNDFKCALEAADALVSRHAGYRDGEAWTVRAAVRKAAGDLAGAKADAAEACARGVDRACPAPR